MDRIRRAVKSKKQIVNKENKYEDAIGLDTNLNMIKPKYKFNSKNEIIL